MPFNCSLKTKTIFLQILKNFKNFTFLIKSCILKDFSQDSVTERLTQKY